MPTNFKVSSVPALRCVNGEPYALPAADRASGFFGRLRLAERLVIQAGPQLALADRDEAWSGGVRMERPAGSWKNIPHA